MFRIGEGRTANAVVKECAEQMWLGVDIAKTNSVRASEDMFRTVTPHLYDAFYDYIETGFFTLSRFTVKAEDMEKATNPIIPVQLTFMYNMVEHLFAYNVTYNKEIKKRWYELNNFIKGFKEVMPKVYVKLMDNWVYMINTKTGMSYKIKEYGLKIVDINPNHRFLTGIRRDGTIVILTGENLDISNRSEWKSASFQRSDDDYRQIEHYNPKSKKTLSFREHTIIMALEYGLEVVKHTIGHNCFLTIDHINNNKNDNKIENLRVITRQTNIRIETRKDIIPYNFLEMYQSLRDNYKNYKLL